MTYAVIDTNVIVASLLTHELQMTDSSRNKCA